jgi:hypothetical protein
MRRRSISSHHGERRASARCRVRANDRATATRRGRATEQQRDRGKERPRGRATRQLRASRGHSCRGPDVHRGCRQNRETPWQPCRRLREPHRRCISPSIECREILHGNPRRHPPKQLRPNKTSPHGYAPYEDVVSVASASQSAGELGLCSCLQLASENWHDSAKSPLEPPQPRGARNPSPCRSPVFRRSSAPAEAPVLVAPVRPRSPLPGTGTCLCRPG